MKILITVSINLFLFASIIAQNNYQGVSIANDPTPPDESAMLDVISNDKGVLIPSIALLADLTDKSMISGQNPADGLLVYCEGTSGAPKGFYYWDAEADTWVAVGNSGGTGGSTEWTDLGNGDIYNTDQKNVGIGVLDPQYKLHLRSSINTSIFLSSLYSNTFSIASTEPVALFSGASSSSWSFLSRAILEINKENPFFNLNSATSYYNSSSSAGVDFSVNNGTTNYILGNIYTNFTPRYSLIKTFPLIKVLENPNTLYGASLNIRSSGGFLSIFNSQFNNKQSKINFSSDRIDIFNETNSHINKTTFNSEGITLNGDSDSPKIEFTKGNSYPATIKHYNYTLLNHNFNGIYISPRLTVDKITVISDSTYKSDITDIKQSLNSLKSIKGHQYVMDHKSLGLAKGYQLYDTIFNDTTIVISLNINDTIIEYDSTYTIVDVIEMPEMKTTEYGVLAQEVEQIFPELVLTDDNGVKSVNYNGLIPITIEAIKELNAKVDTAIDTTGQYLQFNNDDNYSFTSGESNIEMPYIGFGKVNPSESISKFVGIHDISGYNGLPNGSIESGSMGFYNFQDMEENGHPIISRIAANSDGSIELIGTDYMDIMGENLYISGDDIHMEGDKVDIDGEEIDMEGTSFAKLFSQENDTSEYQYKLEAGSIWGMAQISRWNHNIDNNDRSVVVNDYGATVSSLRNYIDDQNYTEDILDINDWSISLRKGSKRENGQSNNSVNNEIVLTDNDIQISTKNTTNGNITLNSVATDDNGDLYIKSNVFISNSELSLNSTDASIALNAFENNTSDSFQPAVEVNASGGFKFPFWVNNTRPNNPQIGVCGYNTELNKLECWDGTTWQQAW